MKQAVVAAVAAVVSTGVWAQVQVYGTIDQAVRSTGGETSMESGTYRTSRLGLQGSEDIGNGLTVKFALEGKLDATNGDMTGDQMFNRESSVSIASKKFGTVTLGRTDTSASEGIDSLAGVSNFGNFAVTSGAEYGSNRPNTIRYTSPKIANIEFQVGQSEADGSKAKLDAASLIYKSKTLSLGAGYEKTAAGDTFTGVGGQINLAGNTIGVMHGRRDAAKDVDVTVVSGRVPLGAWALMGAYSIKDSNGSETKTTTVGTSYNFSKRTMFVAAYQDNDDSDFFQVGLVHRF